MAPRLRFVIAKAASCRRTPERLRREKFVVFPNPFGHIRSDEIHAAASRPGVSMNYSGLRAKGDECRSFSYET